ncbi:MAG: tRNA (adenosine(37)-N6)-threonylcarbamoyltransferase complex dimerization subunit type 1 TsaB [Thermoguttaceae bacterium]|nr:tRNA (adenosine(37)-N6)-threonylcarbamoyltransferase complex dimerization subunit type 1 TsaB [Thermoguttaceae bacterium]
MTQKILALETSETAGSIALQEWDTTSSTPLYDCEERLDPKSRSAQSLAPLLARMLHEAGWSAGDLTTIGISIGPGSFTGLRVGLATAKAIGYVTHAKLVTVDTRDTFAEAFFATLPKSSSATTLVVWVDAQRGQVVTAIYQSASVKRFGPTALSRLSDEKPTETNRQNGGWQRIAVTDRPISISDALTEIAQLPQDTSIWLAGSILNRPTVQAKLPSHLLLVRETLRSPTARAVATITTRKMAAEDYADLWKVQPFYSRPSAAEERRTQQKI